MLIINGIEHNVGTASVVRSYRKEYKYKVTTEDGINHSEVRAVYIDFKLTLGNINAEAYDNLMKTIIENANNIKIKMPLDRSSTEEYVGEFVGVSDSILLENEDGVFWDNLTLEFVGTRPVGVTT